jgi:hypothetical protein
MIFSMIFGKQPRPVFILGCQRSGTTICQDVFLQSGRFDVYRESDTRAMTDNCRLKDDASIDGLIAGSRRQVALFKPINESHWADRYLSRWPDSRVIWIWRNVFDTANSAVVKWGDGQLGIIRTIAEAFADGVDRKAALASMAAVSDRDMYAERLPDDAIASLISWCQSDLTPTAGAAALWWIRNRIYFDLNLDQHPRVMLVRYEDFVRSPATEIARVCDFIGARCSPRLAKAVHSESLRRAEPPPLPVPILDACEALEARLTEAYDQQRAQAGYATVSGR